MLQGTDHDEEAAFTTVGLAVSNSQFVEAQGITAENYQEKIASVLGVSTTRAAEIAAEYPLADYTSPKPDCRLFAAKSRLQLAETRIPTRRRSDTRLQSWTRLRYQPALASTRGSRRLDSNREPFRP